jgi:hypothetical protein
MYITHFTYDYAPYVRSIYMMVTGHDSDGHPMGYEVWPSGMAGTWIVDDEPTIIVHPILSERSEHRVLRAVT